MDDQSNKNLKLLTYVWRINIVGSVWNPHKTSCRNTNYNVLFKFKFKITCTNLSKARLRIRDRVQSAVQSSRGLNGLMFIQKLWDERGGGILCSLFSQLFYKMRGRRDHVPVRCSTIGGRWRDWFQSVVQYSLFHQKSAIREYVDGQSAVTSCRGHDLLAFSWRSMKIMFSLHLFRHSATSRRGR